MKLNEGLKRVREYLGEDVVSIGCKDYGTDYVFFVAPPGTKDTDRVFVGGSPIAVNKQTGKVRDYEDSGLQGKRWSAADE